MICCLRQFNNMSRNSHWYIHSSHLFCYIRIVDLDVSNILLTYELPVILQMFFLQYLKHSKQIYNYIMSKQIIGTKNISRVITENINNSL